MTASIPDRQPGSRGVVAGTSAAQLVGATGAAIAGLMIVARLTGTSIGGGFGRDRRGRWKGWFTLGKDKT